MIQQSTAKTFGAMLHTQRIETSISRAGRADRLTCPTDSVLDSISTSSSNRRLNFQTSHLVEIDVGRLVDDMITLYFCRTAPIANVKKSILDEPD